MLLWNCFYYFKSLWLRTYPMLSWKQLRPDQHRQLFSFFSNCIFGFVTLYLENGHCGKVYTKEMGKIKKKKSRLYFFLFDFPNLFECWILNISQHITGDQCDKNINFLWNQLNICFICCYIWDKDMKLLSVNYVKLSIKRENMKLFNWSKILIMRCFKSMA